MAQPQRAVGCFAHQRKAGGGGFGLQPPAPQHRAQGPKALPELLVRQLVQCCACGLDTGAEGCSLATLGSQQAQRRRRSVVPQPQRQPVVPMAFALLALDIGSAMSKFAGIRLQGVHRFRP